MARTFPLIIRIWGVANGIDRHGHQTHEGCRVAVSVDATSDTMQVVEAWDVSQGDEWWEGLNKVLRSDNLANNAPKLLETELDIFQCARG